MRYCCTKELVPKTKCFQDRLIYQVRTLPYPYPSTKELVPKTKCFPGQAHLPGACPWRPHATPRLATLGLQRTLPVKACKPARTCCYLFQGSACYCWCNLRTCLSRGSSTTCMPLSLQWASRSRLSWACGGARAGEGGWVAKGVPQPFHSVPCCAAYCWTMHCPFSVMPMAGTLCESFFDMVSFVALNL